MSHYLFVVEGIHDVAIISKILMLMEFKEVDRDDQILKPMDKLIIRNFPFYKNSLNVFNKIPTFYKKEDTQVCIINAAGETKLLKVLNSVLKKLEFNEMELIDKVVVFCDGDLKDKEEKIVDIVERGFEGKKNKIDRFSREEILNQTLKIIEVEDFTIPFEFYVFPNNKDSGRLENILLETINQVDSELLYNVEEFLKNIPNEYKQEWSVENSKYEKTKIACVGSVLNPGVANGVHIRDSHWISKETINNSQALKLIYDYIDNILTQNKRSKLDGEKACF